MQSCDVVVVGGGPAGSATAWKAATSGLRVVVCDKASFPRDKPCGDGITPRAVQLIQEMGLGENLERFHRVDSYRVITSSHTLQRPWPHGRIGLPTYGYVVAREDLDAMLLQNAASAGADVREGWQVTAPIIEQGVVRGVRVLGSEGKEHDLRAPVTVAADGMSSRVGRAAGLTPRERRPFAIAVRAQVDSERPEDGTLEIHGTLHHGHTHLPGYGWVFEMGSGQLNIGVGYLSTYRKAKQLNINDVMADFISSLPDAWKLPSVPEMLRSRRLQGWRLPMGLAVWPPWRPGVMVVGDAAGVAKPFTGAGISKALQSGVIAAEVAADALSAGTPHDLGSYEAQVQELWGAYYRLGRGFLRLISNPTVMSLLASRVFPRMSDALVARLLSDIRQRDGEDGSARTYRALLHGAKRLPSGSPGPQRQPHVHSASTSRVPARAGAADSEREKERPRHQQGDMALAQERDGGRSRGS